MKFGLSVPVQHLPDEPGAERIAELIEQVQELFIAPDRRTALREAQPYVEAKYRAYSQWGQDRELSATETFSVPFETLVQDRFILGDPDDCIRQICTHQEQLGITHMKFRVHWPGMPHDLVMRTIRLLGEKVLPACR